MRTRRWTGKKTETLNFKAAADFKEAVDQAAAEDRRERADWLRMVVEDALVARGDAQALPGAPERE